MSIKRNTRLALIVALGWGGLVGPMLAADAITTSVYSQVGNGYKRTKLADGSFAREYYAISNGGALPGTIRDASIEEVKFPQLAGLLAEFLAKRNYHYAPDAKSARLLLVVHWGTTIPFNDVNFGSAVNLAGNSLGVLKATPAVAPAEGVVDIASAPGGAERQAAADQFESDMMVVMMENRARDRANEGNARLLGYIREINDVNDIRRFAGGGDHYDDLRADIEESRFYVIISAYDFKKAVEQGKRELLWVTRISVRSPGNRFSQQMRPMLASGARFFGEESGRLVRRYFQRGSVEIGDVEVLGVVPEARPPAGATPGK